MVVAEVVYCPECDRAYTAITKKQAMIKMLEHVEGQHPEYYGDFIADNKDEWVEGNITP